MMEQFIATQSLHNNEIFRQLNTVVESLVTHNNTLETQISLLAQTPQGPNLKRHADFVTTNSEKQIENLKESESEVKECECEVKESDTN